MAATSQQDAVGQTFPGYWEDSTMPPVFLIFKLRAKVPTTRFAIARSLEILAGNFPMMRGQASRYAITSVLPAFLGLRRFRRISQDSTTVSAFITSAQSCTP